MSKHAHRTRHKTSSGTTVYAKRDKKGRFTDIQNVGKSASADRNRKAKNKPKRRGQGYTGDYANSTPNTQHPTLNT